MRKKSLAFVVIHGYTSPSGEIFLITESFLAEVRTFVRNVPEEVPMR